MSDLIKFKVIDNLLKKSDHSRIYDATCNPSVESDEKIKLGYNCVLHKPLVDEEIQPYNYMFSSIVFSNGNPINEKIGNILRPLILKINPLMVFKIKVNVYPRADKVVIHGFHYDLTSYPDNVLSKIKTAVYCVNTNNGKIVFSDGTELESIENRLIIFNCNTLHSGTTCTDQSVRCVINLNYLDMEI